MGVSFSGTLKDAFSVYLWSRIGNRLLLSLNHFPLESSDSLYDHVRQMAWDEHMTADTTFAILCTGNMPQAISQNFATLRVKDGIADYFREKAGRRPNVDTKNPQIRINLHVSGENAAVSLDLSGQSMHRREYRSKGGEVPIKENVAAAILYRAEWNRLSKDGYDFVDPMCGSGTLVIEAAHMAGDSAPGLFRKQHGFSAWKGHEAEVWQQLLKDAQERHAEGISHLQGFAGYDVDANSVRYALANANAAGLSGKVTIEQREVKSVRPRNDMQKRGLIAVNPPYGKRSGHDTDLLKLYGDLGSTLLEHFPGWKTSLFTEDEELSKSTGLHAHKINVLFNGPIRCILAHSQIPHQRIADTKLAVYSDQFANRLTKNSKRVRSWAEKAGVSSYRVYDADMPEFSAAIDLFENKWVHVQEYEAPRTIDPEHARQRFQVILDTIPKMLGVQEKDIFTKTRERQRSGAQYGKMGDTGEFQEIHEGGLSFLVNLTDYLDTGIFLDHRLIRNIVRNESKGRRFLNLFAYTGTATVYAADGGASLTVNVDSSNTYTNWAKENLHLNGFFADRYRLVRSEAREWLTKERGQYDLILLDPPTFSRSKSFKKSLQIQDDHVEIIRLAAERLSDDGVLFFSTHYKRFKLDESLSTEFSVENLSAETVPFDFARTPRIHQFWRLSHR